MARLLQLSDLHVVAPGSLASGRLDTPALLRAAIDVLLDRLDAIGPIDAVLLTGDISDDGCAESYDMARTELARLGLPLLVLPGNHDHRERFRSAFSDLPGVPETGLIDWVIDVEGTRVIGLDTLIEGQGAGRLRSESLAFLSESMDSARDRPIVLALHHPPVRTGIRFMDAIGLENPDDLALHLAQSEVPVRILAGHVHGVYHGWLGPHPVSTAPSLCSAFALDLRQDAPVGFMMKPTGVVLIDTAPGGVWAELPLDYGDGPFGF
jgi:3',5'-cyclic AMP phosphodiesterase CpdA